MTSEEDDWQHRAKFGQALLQLRAAQFRYPHVEENAVLAVLVAIDHRTAKLAVEEQAEAIAADGGHRSQPFVFFDQSLLPALMAPARTKASISNRHALSTVGRPPCRPLP